MLPGSHPVGRAQSSTSVHVEDESRHDVRLEGSGRPAVRSLVGTVTGFGRLF